MTCHALRLGKPNWCKRLLLGESGAKGVEWYENHHRNLLTSIFLIHELVAFPCCFLCKWSNWHSWNSAHKKTKVFPRANLQMLLREQCLESMVREPKYLGHFWLGYIRMLGQPIMSAHLSKFEGLRPCVHFWHSRNILWIWAIRKFKVPPHPLLWLLQLDPSVRECSLINYHIISFYFISFHY